MTKHVPTDHVIPCAYGHGNPLKGPFGYTCEGLDDRGESVIDPSCPNALVTIPTVAEWNSLMLSQFEEKDNILNRVLNILQHSADVTSRNDLVKATYTAAIQAIRKIRKTLTIDIYDVNDPDKVAQLLKPEERDGVAIHTGEPGGVLGVAGGTEQVETAELDEIPE